ncbi:MAG: CsbD family protein [Sedimentisphaerales bacterium]|nr:CsbD family protein [Sedimentisphaerales bacterium]
MNKDQIKGKAKDIGGKVQEEVGKLVGNEHQQAEGLKNQVAGKLQEKVGDLKQTINKATKIK